MLPAPAHPLAPPRSPLSPRCSSTTPLPTEAFGGLSRAPLLCPEPALPFERSLGASHSFTRCWPLGWGGCGGRRGRIPTGEPRPPGPAGLCAEGPPLLTAQGLSPGPWDSDRQSAHPKGRGCPRGHRHRGTQVGRTQALLLATSQRLHRQRAGVRTPGVTLGGGSSQGPAVTLKGGLGVPPAPPTWPSPGNSAPVPLPARPRWGPCRQGFRDPGVSPLTDALTSADVGSEAGGAPAKAAARQGLPGPLRDRKSTRLNSSH